MAGRTISEGVKNRINALAEMVNALNAKCMNMIITGNQSDTINMATIYVDYASGTNKYSERYSEFERYVQSGVNQGIESLDTALEIIGDKLIREMKEVLIQCDTMQKASATIQRRTIDYIYRPTGQLAQQQFIQATQLINPIQTISPTMTAPMSPNYQPNYYTGVHSRSTENFEIDDAVLLQFQNRYKSLPPDKALDVSNLNYQTLGGVRMVNKMASIQAGKIGLPSIGVVSNNRDRLLYAMRIIAEDDWLYDLPKSDTDYLISKGVLSRNESAAFDESDDESDDNE